jgi:N6-L-threonylcarbamoyladenine synthase
MINTELLKGQSVKILGVETSCDETAAAVVENGTRILSNIVASQIEIHARYGGIVPEVASRQHLLSITSVIEMAISEAKTLWQDIDGIAVTFGPGLAGSLLVGVNIAKAIALGRNLPFTGVNHLEAHVYANWLNKEDQLYLPSLCLIISGGHSDLVLMKGHGQFEKLGRTRDDAAGEALDKAARILGLGYPGGPAIEEAASRGKACLYFPRAWLKGSYDFSFSGLKTALWHFCQKNKISANAPMVADVAASFQDAVIDVLVTKTINAVEELQVKQILVSGGVASNKFLTQRFLESSPVPVLIPPPYLCTDNAAMVAACGYYHFQNSNLSGYDLDAVPSLSIG